MPHRENHLKGYALGLLATLLWASYYPAARYIFGTETGRTDPFLLSLIRFSFAVLFFIPFVFFSEKRRAELPGLIRKEWKILLLLAFSGVLIQGILVFVSLKYTTAARGSLMANACPVFTVLLAWLFLKEKITRSMWIGMVTGFAGISLAMFSKSSDIFSTNSSMMLFGDFLALLSGVAWGGYTIAGVRVVKQYDPHSVTMLTFLLGALMTPVVMLIFGSSFDFHLSWRLWIGMLYMGFVTGGAAFCIWLSALRYVPSSKLGAYGYLSALLAATSSIVFLKEKISWIFAVSVVLTLGGMYLLMRKPDQKAISGKK